MPRFRTFAAIAALAAAAAAPAAMAQTESAPASVKPGPEHKVFQRMVGTWDATTVMQGLPASKGVETDRLIGGLWLVADFKGDMGGQPFEGHGLYGYDPDKKKYVGAWIDTQSTSIQFQEGTLSPDGNSMTMTGEMKNPMGEGTVTIKMVDAFTGDDTRVFAMKMPMPGGGGEIDVMTITYKRRK